jgi:hypothetical protein
VEAAVVSSVGGACVMTTSIVYVLPVCPGDASVCEGKGHH